MSKLLEGSQPLHLAMSPVIYGFFFASQSSIIDRFGRRILLWGGYLLMALVLVLLETSLLLSVSKCLSRGGPASEIFVQDST